MPKALRALLALSFTLLLVYALDRPWGQVPPLGKLLDPLSGVWQNAEAPTNPGSALTVTAPGALRAPVTVRYDSLGVPHIFADNEDDLFFAQGYVTARDRLWQMEFQTRAAAGRLSEVIGARTREYDRYQRRFGMVRGAYASLDSMLADPTCRKILTAYAAGVNTYLAALSPADYPFEYKLLDYAPEPWTPLKTALLLKSMSYSLTSYSAELRMTNVRQRIGPARTKALFPNHPFFSDPIIPAGTAWGFEPLPRPPAPDSVGGATAVPDTLLSTLSAYQVDPANGSNNWAVAGSRTATGYPLLANDPHLGLSLPSLWYQIHLHAPGYHVAGVSLPGAPAVIIGFNERIAWGVTNVGADVLDWYEIEFQDEARVAYRHEGSWQPVSRTVDTVIVRGEATVYDTILATHHGPVVYTDGQEPLYPKVVPTGYALRWLAHEGGKELLTFYHLNRAQNYQDYVDALSFYDCPAQNFAFASQEGDIALWVNGKFPLKWKGQGKFLLDGRRAAHDWQGWVPRAHNPHVKNPPRGFVSSANQHSADTSYPYYLDWRMANDHRGRRINERLAQMNAATADSLRLLQNDNYYVLAERILPPLLATLSPTDDSTAALRDTLRAWDYYYEAYATAPTFFEAWCDTLAALTWDELAGDTLRYPSLDVLTEFVLNRPDDAWFDLQGTERRETMADLSRLAFEKAYRALRAELGPLGEAWRWGRYQDTEVRHVARVPGLGAEHLNVGGGAGSVNATKKRHGPSWRMVVSLEPPVNAYGVYPGGQSGNPGSPFYDNLLSAWREGKLYPIAFPATPEDLPTHHQITLTP